jgi:hypothetical protein
MPSVGIDVAKSLPPSIRRRPFTFFSDVAQDEGDFASSTYLDARLAST